MAKFISGIGFAQASGSIAGTTYSRNRFGAYIRDRAIPVNPRTPRQIGNRNRFGNLAEGWRNLTKAQRDAWIGIAPTVTLRNSLGQSYTPSGFGLYMSHNMKLAAAGLPSVLLPGTPDAPPAPAIASAPIWTISPAALRIDVDPPTGTNRLVVAATAAVSEGVQFVGPKEFRQVTVLDSTDVGPQDVLAAYTAVFGTPSGVAGSQIYFRIYALSSTGWASDMAETIAAAA